MPDEDLVSVRNLVDSDFDLPVREFDGVFGSFETAPATGYDGTRVSVNYGDIDNVVAVSPYNLPTVVLNMGLSNKHKSKWGYYGDSLAALIPPDEDIKDCKGQVHHVVLADGQDGRPAPKPIWSRDADPAEFPDKMVPTPVWVVTAVNGATVEEASGEKGQAAPDWAEKNLIGKSRADFNKWAYADPKIRKDTALQRSITDKSFINSLLKLGRVHEDADGIFQAGPTPGE